MNTILFHSLIGIAGIAGLYYGAEALIRGGVNIARKLGVSPLLIGLTLVAFGTSAPELVVSIDAALHNNGNIAVGNVVGSNICNIALILGLCALLKPISVNEKLFKLDLPLMIGASVLFTVFYFLDGHGISRWQGILFLVILAAYLWKSFMDGKQSPEELEEAAAEGSGKLLPVWAALLFAAAGLAMLCFGARGFITSAIFFAKCIGVSDAVIALTVVALGTSLPELATSVVAVLRNERDIAIGNIVGSNIFNILVIMGIAPTVRTLSAPDVSWVDLAAMVACAVLLYPVMKTGKRVSRGEGILFLVIYICYTGWLFWQKNFTL